MTHKWCCCVILCNSGVVVFLPSPSPPPVLRLCYGPYFCFTFFRPSFGSRSFFFYHIWLTKKLSLIDCQNDSATFIQSRVLWIGRNLTTNSCTRICLKLFFYTSFTFHYFLFPPFHIWRVLSTFVYNATARFGTSLPSVSFQPVELSVSHASGLIYLLSKCKVPIPFPSIRYDRNGHVHITRHTPPGAIYCDPFPFHSFIIRHEQTIAASAAKLKRERVVRRGRDGVLFMAAKK